jgi:hypothetical protein
MIDEGETLVCSCFHKRAQPLIRVTDTSLVVILSIKYEVRLLPRLR